jgi:hypothetical protein
MDLAGTPAREAQVSRCYCRICAGIRKKDCVRPLDTSRELTALATGVFRRLSMGRHTVRYATPSAAMSPSERHRVTLAHLSREVPLADAPIHPLHRY